MRLLTRELIGRLSVAEGEALDSSISVIRIIEAQLK